MALALPSIAWFFGILVFFYQGNMHYDVGGKEINAGSDVFEIAEEIRCYNGMVFNNEEALFLKEINMCLQILDPPVKV